MFLAYFQGSYIGWHASFSFDLTVEFLSLTREGILLEQIADCFGNIQPN
jgi:hypothetical protein